MATPGSAIASDWPTERCVTGCAARLFLAEHRDLAAWMTRPTRTRLADLHRIKAWPLLSWAALSRAVRLDVDLLAAKDLGGMSATVRQLWPQDFQRLWDTARRLGWSYYWSRSVIDQFVPAVLAWSQTDIGGIDTATLDYFAAALQDVSSASATTLKQWHGRLFALRQLLFESGQLSTPPKRGPTGASIEQRLAAVPATAIRRAMTRYVHARAAVLSSSSVDGLVNDLIPFGVFLGERFPTVQALRQLERHHIESFLAFNRTRTWRGRLARDQRVSTSVAHSTVLTVRNFLDDIAVWGWADRPRRRLVFASDVPRLPRPLPRALTPDVDAPSTRPSRLPAAIPSHAGWPGHTACSTCCPGLTRWAPRRRVSRDDLPRATSPGTQRRARSRAGPAAQHPPARHRQPSTDQRSSGHRQDRRARRDRPPGPHHGLPDRQQQVRPDRADLAGRPAGRRAASWPRPAAHIP
jgi:hypothetical protein